jgi:hypothetical protein
MSMLSRFAHILVTSIHQAEKNRELSLVRAEEEDKIATALARRTLEKERKDKEIQQLREQSSELRE